MAKPAVLADLESPSAHSRCLEELAVCAMNDSRGSPEGHEGPDQGPCQPLYRWHRHRKPWRSSQPRLSPQQPLDRYKWRTSTCPPPRETAPIGSGRIREPIYLQLLSHLRFGRHSREQSPTGRQSQTRTRPDPGSLHRILPYLRSLSEPGTSSGQRMMADGEMETDTGHRAPTVSSIFTLFSRRISRVLRDEPEGAESGRTQNMFMSDSSG